MSIYIAQFCPLGLCATFYSLLIIDGEGVFILETRWPPPFSYPRLLIQHYSQLPCIYNPWTHHALVTGTHLAWTPFVIGPNLLLSIRLQHTLRLYSWKTCLLQNIPGITSFLIHIKSRFKLQFLQKSSLVQLYSSVSDCKGVGNIPGTNLVKPFQLLRRILILSVASQKRRSLDADFIEGNR